MSEIIINASLRVFCVWFCHYIYGFSIDRRHHRRRQRHRRELYSSQWQLHHRQTKAVHHLFAKKVNNNEKKFGLKLRSMAATFACSLRVFFFALLFMYFDSVDFVSGSNRESINQFMCACGISLSIFVIYAIFIEFMYGATIKTIPSPVVTMWVIRSCSSFIRYVRKFLETMMDFLLSDFLVELRQIFVLARHSTVLAQTT